MMNIKIILLLLITVVTSAYAEIRKEFYPNGDIKSEAHFKDNQRHGQAKFYYEGHVLRGIAEFKEGKLDGEQFGYDENGKLKFKVIFANNLQIGRAQYFKNDKPMNGAYKEKTDYYGEWISTYKDGYEVGLQFTCTNDYCQRRMVEEDGSYTLEVLVDEQILTSSYYKNDALEGEYIEYYRDEDHSVRYKAQYKDGKKDGLATMYHENGEISQETDYKGGRITKNTRYYDDDGDLIVKTNPYTGHYEADRSMIKDAHILRDIKRNDKRGMEQIVLHIDDNFASLLGQQIGWKRHVRFYTPCLLEDGSLHLVNNDNKQEDYCDLKEQKNFILKLKKDKDDPYTVICENCEAYGFPPVWVRD